jgi:hypothetical protein
MYAMCSTTERPILELKTRPKTNFRFFQVKLIVFLQISTQSETSLDSNIFDSEQGVLNEGKPQYSRPPSTI